jgi:hypothetical protein
VVIAADACLFTLPGWSRLLKIDPSNRPKLWEYVGCITAPPTATRKAEALAR